MKPVNYLTDATALPIEYACTTCGAHGVKLWREYQTAYTDLECVRCAVEGQREVSKTAPRDAALVGDDGCTEYMGVRCDQIGWRVPAVPTEDGTGYWGYGAVPNLGVLWWKRLPTHPKAASGGAR